MHKYDGLQRYKAKSNFSSYFVSFSSLNYTNRYMRIRTKRSLKLHFQRFKRESLGGKSN